MAIYNINNETRNFLTRGFVTSEEDLNPFWVVQDPTFLTFKVEFFFPEYVSSPDSGTAVSDFLMTDQYLFNNFSQEGLLVPPKYNIDAKGFNPGSNSPNDPIFTKAFVPSEFYFNDSAEDYLYSIGSVNRIGYLRTFKQLLYKLQTEAPWYFQKISGMDSIYKIDPSNISKKEALLTFECLESVDMRMSLLADAYRQAAFDFERHREVLPHNLRTFKMRIHIYEMRNFNATYGVIANLLGGLSSKQYQEQILTADFKPVFDAISVQTYELGMCEFDFYSIAPSYMDEASVADVSQAAYKFGVKFGSVRKIAKYSFYNYLTDYLISNSMFPQTFLEPMSFPISGLNIGNPNVQQSFYDTHDVEQTVKTYLTDVISSPVFASPDNLPNQSNSDTLVAFDNVAVQQADNEFGNPKAASGALAAAEQQLALRADYITNANLNSQEDLVNADNIYGNGSLGGALKAFVEQLIVSPPIQENPMEPLPEDNYIQQEYDSVPPPTQPSISPKNIFS
jgi:hypothetical protein